MAALDDYFNSLRASSPINTGQFSINAGIPTSGDTGGSQGGSALDQYFKTQTPFQQAQGMNTGLLPKQPTIPNVGNFSIEAGVPKPSGQPLTASGNFSPIAQPSAQYSPETEKAASINPLAIAQDFGQGIARIGASGALSLLEPAIKLPVIGPALENSDFLSNLKNEPNNPDDKSLYNFLFGSEPNQTYSERIANATQTAQKLGLGPLSGGLAALGVIGGDALNFLPGGDGEAIVAKEIANSTDAGIISGLLKKIGIPDNLISSAAEKLAGITKPEEVLQNLQELKNTIKDTYIVPDIVNTIVQAKDPSVISSALNNLGVEKQYIGPAAEILTRTKDPDTVRGALDFLGGLHELPTPEELTATLPKGKGIGFSDVASGAKQDVAEAVGGFKKIYTDIKNTLSPQFASTEATQTADFIRKSKAEIANFNDIQAKQFKNTAEFFNSLSDEENIATVSNYEKTGKFSTEPVPGYSDFYKKSTDEARTALQAVYGEDRVGYIDNYVKRQFAFKSAEDESKATKYFEEKYSKSLSASKTSLKERTLDVPLDEALADMKARGIDATLATSNPELLRQWTVKNAQRATTYAEAWNNLKENNLVQLIRNGDEIPDGYVKLDDRAAKVFSPAEVHYPTGETNPAGDLKFGKSGYKQTLETGSYYADPSVAKILDNSISQGFTSPTFKGLRTLENSLNQFQLGISGFHLLGTALNAGVSQMANGFRQIARGLSKMSGEDLLGGIKSLALAPVPFASFTKDLYQGRKFINDLVSENPEAKQFLEEVLNPSGGRLSLDTQYRNQAYKKMMTAFSQAWSDGRVLKGIEGIARVPLALTEVAAKPLMEYAIPRVKMGAFMDLANDVLARLPETATPIERAGALRDAWDSIDNRFGQLVYDNLFWNQKAKDIAFLSTRSFGWNLGTVRELGGGATDFLTQTLKGKGLSDRTMYAITLPIYVGMLGAAYMYLHTGKGPSELKDYFYPKNGLKDANGNDDRIQLPTYMRDVHSYTTNPIGTIFNKVSPIVQMTADLATNKDYFGNLIRNPDDPIVKQFDQVSKYLFNTIEPFSIQNFQKVKKEGANPEKLGEGLLGVTKAPADEIKSQQQLDLEKAARQAKPRIGAMTPEQQDKAQANSDLKLQARQEYQRLSQLPKDQAHSAFDDIIKNNPDLAKAIIVAGVDASRGTTKADNILKSLPVTDRAQYIYDQVMQLPADQRKAYYQSLIDKHVVTEKVNEAIMQLKQNQ